MSHLSQNFATLDTAGYVGILNNGSQLNGRVDIISPSPKLDIESYKTKQTDNTYYSKEAIQGQITSNNLTEIFFSTQNINALQEAIRYRVYIESNRKYTIGRQSDQELKIIMRSIYLQYSQNLDTDCIGQTRALNQRVLDSAVPEVLSNLYQYETYRKDASTLPMPLDRAPLLSTRGTKTLELKNFM
uniref:Minor capsid protein P8 central region domain-containing protein n=1 Tax=viral metagenome TaxID=1070528 RepID=A0A6C0KU12_9ZZZZ